MVPNSSPVAKSGISEQLKAKQQGSLNLNKLLLLVENK